MKNQFGNKTEIIKGNLVKTDFGWEVQSGYGRFALSSQLQLKPTEDLIGCCVEAIVSYGQVTDYHFSDERID